MIRWRGYILDTPEEIRGDLHRVVVHASAGRMYQTTHVWDIWVRSNPGLSGDCYWYYADTNYSRAYYFSAAASAMLFKMRFG
jgi:hypothetical protein